MSENSVTGNVWYAASMKIPEFSPQCRYCISYITTKTKTQSSNCKQHAPSPLKNGGKQIYKTHFAPSGASVDRQTITYPTHHFL